MILKLDTEYWDMTEENHAMLKFASKYFLKLI